MPAPAVQHILELLCTAAAVHRSLLLSIQGLGFNPLHVVDAAPERT